MMKNLERVYQASALPSPGVKEAPQQGSEVEHEAAVMPMEDEGLMSDSDLLKTPPGESPNLLYQSPISDKLLNLEMGPALPASEVPSLMLMSPITDKSP